MSLLSHCADFLDPFAHLMGLDGVILMAFILGFPANEIVLPIVIMAYLAQGSLVSMDNLLELQSPIVRPRMDLDHRRLHHAFFPYALALLHHPADHPQGDPELEVDGACGGFAHGGGGAVLHGVCQCGAAVPVSDPTVKNDRKMYFRSFFMCLILVDGIDDGVAVTG